MLLRRLPLVLPCLALLLASVPAAQAQDAYTERLETSPRHHEWVAVPAGDGRVVHSFVAYPETDAPALPVLVIHENRGLTDWVRGFADALAEAGYLAVAPDLLSGFDADHDRTADFASSDAARDALYQLSPAQVTGDLQAVLAFVTDLPAAQDDAVAVGFCWGGAQTFRLATNADLEAAFVFYGSPPDSSRLAHVRAPIYGFYGGDDARINATIPATQAAMESLGKPYHPVIYDGAGHAFMRQGAQPDASPANAAAREQSWDRLLMLLDQYAASRH